MLPSISSFSFFCFPFWHFPLQMRCVFLLLLAFMNREFDVVGVYNGCFEKVSSSLLCKLHTHQHCRCCILLSTLHWSGCTSSSSSVLGCFDMWWLWRHCPAPLQLPLLGPGPRNLWLKKPPKKHMRSGCCEPNVIQNWTPCLFALFCLWLCKKGTNPVGLQKSLFFLPSLRTKQTPKTETLWRTANFFRLGILEAFFGKKNEQFAIKSHHLLFLCINLGTNDGNIESFLGT